MVAWCCICLPWASKERDLHVASRRALVAVERAKRAAVSQKDVSGTLNKMHGISGPGLSNSCVESATFSFMFCI